MRNAVADYAIPRSKLAEAKARDRRFNSTEAVAELVERAKRSFTDLTNTGEGGEMLLFLLAERFLKLPQILCKMDLKTDNRMHYHGADGVYAGVTPEGILKLYWGESKVYGDASSAIRDCFNSLAPFLIEPEHEEAERESDLILLSDKADLSNPASPMRSKSILISRQLCLNGSSIAVSPLWASTHRSIPKAMRKGLRKRSLKHPARN
jgi:hypothetical protein